MQTIFKLPSEIEEAAKEEAQNAYLPNWAQGIDLNSAGRSGFKHGVEWLYQHLQTLGAEFDQSAMNRAWHSGHNTGEAIARWQHAQLAAQIVALKADNEALRQMRTEKQKEIDELVAECGTAEKQRDQLSAQIAALKAENERLKKELG